MADRVSRCLKRNLSASTHSQHRGPCVSASSLPSPRRRRRARRPRRKTQLCHTLCVTSQINSKRPGKVCYIDTEGTFQPARIRPIAERFGVDPVAVLDNIVYARAHTWEAQVQLLGPLAAKMADEQFKLVIMDSVTANFRVDFSGACRSSRGCTPRWRGAPASCAATCAVARAALAALHPHHQLLKQVLALGVQALDPRPSPPPPAGRGELAERQQRLGHLMQTLKKMAEEYNVAVFITNQIMSDPSGGMSECPAVLRCRALHEACLPAARGGAAARLHASCLTPAVTARRPAPSPLSLFPRARSLRGRPQEGCGRPRPGARLHRPPLPSQGQGGAAAGQAGPEPRHARGGGLVRHRSRRRGGLQGLRDDACRTSRPPQQSCTRVAPPHSPLRPPHPVPWPRAALPFLCTRPF